MLCESHIAVRYPDCDPMGIVHHAVYPIWYEIARMDYFEKVGYPYTEMNKSGINPPMVNLNLNYHSPVKYPGKVTVRTECTLCQGKKLELRYSVYSGDQLSPVATATSFHIWTGPDMRSLDMRTIPEVYEKLSNAVERPAVLILAGGRSTRMGTDKKQIEWDGTTLLNRAIAFWKEAMPEAEIFVSLGYGAQLPELPEYVTAILDEEADLGPMGGIYSAFRKTGKELFAVSAVDMPLINTEALSLLNQKRCHGEDICIFTKDGKPEPLFGFYRSTCVPIMEEILRGSRKMSDVIRKAKATLVPLPRAEWTANVNTPEELNELKKM